eukprot:12905895-Prorocentrum_lima.AAC.1
MAMDAKHWPSQRHPQQRVLHLCFGRKETQNYAKAFRLFFALQLSVGIGAVRERHSSQDELRQHVLALLLRCLVVL